MNGSYNPTEKTAIDFEFAASKNDLNLFSSLGDQDNMGVASQLSIAHQLLETSKQWTLNLTSDIDYIQNDFRTYRETL